MSGIVADKPRRRHVVEIELQADTWKDMVEHLYSIARYLEENGPGRRLISGGYSAGYIVVDKENPDITHDSYFEALDKYLEASEVDRNGEGDDS